MGGRKHFFASFEMSVQSSEPKYSLSGHLVLLESIQLFHSFAYEPMKKLKSDIMMMTAVERKAPGVLQTPCSVWAFWHLCVYILICTGIKESLVLFI